MPTIPPQCNSLLPRLSLSSLPTTHYISTPNRTHTRIKHTNMDIDCIANDQMYRECLRNHAASLGSYATDGCGEFTLDPTSGSLNCVACGCHRNFHRKLTNGRLQDILTPDVIDYGNGGRQLATMMAYSPDQSSSKKRFRTKFSEDQKERMMEFAEKLGWKLQRKDGEDEIEKFCRGVGISRKVFKVWMHNHKNSTSHSSTTDDQ